MQFSAPDRRVRTARPLSISFIHAVFLSRRPTRLFNWRRSNKVGLSFGRNATAKVRLLLHARTWDTDHLHDSLCKWRRWKCCVICWRVFHEPKWFYQQIAAVATLTSSLVEIVRDETKFPNPVVKIFAFALNVTNCVLAVLLCLSSLVVKKLLGSHENGVKGLEPSLIVWLLIAGLCTIESLVHFVYAFVYVSWKSALVYLLPTGKYWT